MKIILHQSLFKILLILISISITFIIVFISIEFCLHDTSAQKESLTLELSGIFTKKGVISVYYTNNNGKLSNLKKMQDVYYNESGAMQAINFNLDTLPENQRIIIVFNNKCRDNQYIENISYFFPSINKNYSLNCNLHLNISNNYAMYPKEIKQNILKNKFNYPFTIISPSIPKLDFVSTHEHIETLLFSLLFTSIIILITYLLQFPFNIKQFMIINGSWLVYLIIFWGTKDIEFRSFFSDKLSAIPQMEIGMIIPYTEKISLIINNQKYKPFSKENENIIERLVNGSSEIQNLVFPLPCNVNIRKLRLYVGSIPFGTREIHYIRFRKLEKYMT